MMSVTPQLPVARLIARQSALSIFRERTVALLSGLFVVLVLISAYLGWSATSTVNSIYSDAVVYGSVCSQTGNSHPLVPNWVHEAMKPRQHKLENDMKFTPKIALLAATLMTVSAAPAAFAETADIPLQMVNPYKGVHAVQAALEADFAILEITNVNYSNITLQELIDIEAVIVNQANHDIKRGQIEQILAE